MIYNSWLPTPRPVAQTFQPGEQVKLYSPPYGVERVGTLIGDRPVWGRYALHTIRLPDGLLYRSEGILLPA